MMDIPLLPQLTLYEIDIVLMKSIQKNISISIQLNQKDLFGRQKEPIAGHFKGYLAENKILIDFD